MMMMDLISMLPRAAKESEETDLENNNMWSKTKFEKDDCLSKEEMMKFFLELYMKEDCEIQVAAENAQARVSQMT